MPVWLHRSPSASSGRQLIAPGSDVPALELYYAAADAETRCVLLLLEDLAEGCPGDVPTGATVIGASSVLGAIAPFHAHWWQNPQLDTFSWVPNWGETLTAQSERSSRRASTIVCRRQ